MKDEFKRTRTVYNPDIGRKKDSKKLGNRLARHRLRRKDERHAAVR